MLDLSIKTEGNFEKNFKKFAQRHPELIDQALRVGSVRGLKLVIKRTPNRSSTLALGWKREKIANFIYSLFNQVPYAAHVEKGTKAHGPKKAKFLHFPIIRGNTIIRWVKTKRVKGIKARKMVGANTRNIANIIRKNFKTNLFKIWRAI